MAGVDKNIVFGLIGKTVSGISTSSSYGEYGGVVIYFTDGSKLSIDERYSDAPGWAGFDVCVEIRSMPADVDVSHPDIATC